MTVDHAHHWVISSARGPTSDGVCRYCGTVKKFQNTIEVQTENLFNYHPHHLQGTRARSWHFNNER